MSELKDHAEICPNRPVECFCGQIIRRNLLADHLKTDDDHLLTLFDRLVELETKYESLERQVSSASEYGDHKHDIAFERGWRPQVFFFPSFPYFFQNLHTKTTVMGALPPQQKIKFLNFFLG